MTIYSDGTFVTGHIKIKELVRLIIAPKNTCTFGDYNKHTQIFAALLKNYNNEIKQVFRCLQGYFLSYDKSLRSTSDFSRVQKSSADKSIDQMIGTVNDETASAYQLIRNIHPYNEVIDKIWSVDNPNPFFRDGGWSTTSRGILVMKEFTMDLPPIFLIELKSPAAKKFIDSIKLQISQVNKKLKDKYIFDDRIGTLTDDGKITYKEGADIMACPYFIFFNIFILANKIQGQLLSASQINSKTHIIELNFPAWRDDLYKQIRGNSIPSKSGKIYMLKRTTALITYAYFEMADEVNIYDTSCEAINLTLKELKKTSFANIDDYILSVHSDNLLRGGKKTNKNGKKKKTTIKTRRKKIKPKKMRKTKKH